MNSIVSPLGSGQYVRISLGRVGCSGQIKVTWEVEGYLLTWQTLPFLQILLYLGATSLVYHYRWHACAYELVVCLQDGREINFATLTVN